MTAKNSGVASSTPKVRREPLNYTPKRDDKHPRLLHIGGGGGGGEADYQDLFLTQKFTVTTFLLAVNCSTYFIRLGTIPISLFWASSSLTRHALQHPMCPLYIVSVTYRMSPFLKLSSPLEFAMRSNRALILKDKINSCYRLTYTCFNVSFENLALHQDNNP